MPLPCPIPDHLAESYRQAQDRRMMPLLRLVLIAAVLLNLLFLAWDHRLAPGSLAQTSPLRLGFILLALALLIASRLRQTWPFLPAAFIIAVMGAGAAITARILLILPAGFDRGLAAFAFFLVGAAIIAPSLPILSLGLAILLASVNLVMLVGEVGGDILFNTNFFLIGLSVLALTLGALMQHQQRRAFLLEREAEAARQELDRLATTDDLTGLANRRHFFALTTREIDRSQRYGHALSVLMLEVDHFKRINDRYGQEIGDEVLRRLGETLRGTLRDSDILARMGGEEFAILLPETKLIIAHEVAERLRAAAAEIRLPLARDLALSFTISIGVTQLNAAETGIRAPLKRADAALHAAKNKGRNRIELN